MRKDKEQDPQWITANQAAEIISSNSGHTVQADYVRLLSRTKPHILKHKPRSGNVSLYFKPQVEQIIVKRRRVSGKSETPDAA